LIPFAKDTTPQEYMENARAIHETFDAVLTDDPQRFSEGFYKELVESQPDIADLFKNTEFKQQGAKFISMVRHCIHLLDDHRTFEYKMVELGKVHHTYGVQISQLQSFGEVFTSCVQHSTSLKWTERYKKAWQWFWKIVVDLFSRGILEHLEEKKDMEDQKKEQQEVREAVINALNDNGKTATEQVNEEEEEFVFDLRGRYTHSKLVYNEKQSKRLKEDGD